MDFTLGNAGMLAGLAALALPLLIHLLRRRQREVVDWGAMQFLPVGVARRRRRTLEELLLLALRMGIIALVVLALATPSSTSPVFAPLSDRPARDVVIVLDGSFSMARRAGDAPTPWDRATQWADEYLAHLGRSERAAVIVARQPPLVAQATFSADRGTARETVAALPSARGNAGLAEAATEALRLLREQGEARDGEIILVTDRQRFGWADAASTARWEALARQLESSPIKLRVIDVGGAPEPTPNVSLAPLVVSRGLLPVGREVQFKSAVRSNDADRASRPAKLVVEVGGKPLRELPVPADTPRGGQVPITFARRFDTPGCHLVSLVVDPGGADALDVDNRQHVAIDVVRSLPVVLVDVEGESAEGAGFFLRRALGPSPGDAKASPVNLVSLAAARLMPEHLRNPKPAVVILADVPTLSDEQHAAFAAYVRGGGTALVVLGPRVELGRDAYNDKFFQAGKGWLPAKLVETVAPTEPARPEPRTFLHPALDLFRAEPSGSLGQVRLPRWWKVAADAKQGGAPVAMLNTGDPLLVEKAVGDGRVILCTVPLDRSWDSTLPGTWEYPVLVHELVYYLAGAGASGRVLGEGKPLRLAAPAGSEAAEGHVFLRTPEGERTLRVREWPWNYEHTGAVGSYHVRRGDDPERVYVVPPDPRESDLASCTDEEWKRITDVLPIAATEEGGKPGDDAHRRHELWWLFLAGVVLLLCGEVALTRRLVKSRGR